MAKAVKIFTGFSMDYTSQRQAAIREDGAVFTRIMSRGRYGYAWSAWRSAAAVPAGFNEASATDACINNRAYFGPDGRPSVRLPN
jgi:hypothetical protein